MNPIYLDYAATTPVDVRVAEKMNFYLTRDGIFGNPASSHVFGQQAKLAVAEARAQVADLIQAEPSEIIFTSGATEANNLALKGAAQLYQRRGKHLITLKTEHKSVLDCCQQLEKEGYLVTYLYPERNGLLDMNKLTAALRDDTILVSVMHVNNEIGVIQDMAAIAEITAARGILLHVDAAQSVGKAAIEVRNTPIDLLSLSAHKVYGPKGIGALYVRKKPRVRVAPQIQGGGHEQGMRSGTLATHQIVGMGEAFRIAQQEMQQEIANIRMLRNRFLLELQAKQAVTVNGDLQHAVPHILNLRFANKRADDLLAQMPNIAASTASACQGKGVEASYVLRALGLTEEEAKSSIRFSFGRLTTAAEVDSLIQQMSTVLTSPKY